MSPRRMWCRALSRLKSDLRIDTAGMRTVVVTGSFDNLESSHVRFLEEASKLGDVHVVLWPDRGIQAATGRPPKFLQEERLYLLQSIRHVQEVTIPSRLDTPDAIPEFASRTPRPQVWVVDERAANPRKKRFCEMHGVEYRVLAKDQLRGFPSESPCSNPAHPARGKVVVTGCFDWFHSGHVKFFEEVSQLGDLYVVVGHDANVRLLKGEGHPLFPQDERRYLVQSVRYVKQALVSTGHGWMDAEPEIALIKPDVYAVNEDGDKPEKRAFCQTRGIEYVVLKRIPKEGLPARQSTDLRGF
jgi:cytidyltransferase-like protein